MNPTPRKRQGRGRGGLTLVELLAATALAALLTAAVAGVLRGMIRHERGLRPEPAVPRAVAERLRRDLLLARRMHLRPDRLVLVGYAGRDPATGAATLRPTEVAYRVRSAGHTPWLVREERPLAATGVSGQELLCPGVTAIRGVRAADGLDLGAPADGPAELAPVPQGVRFTLVGPDGPAAEVFLPATTEGL